MSKDISQYLHLYLGCEMQIYDKWGNPYQVTKPIDFHNLYWYLTGDDFKGYIFKPILRPLSDMSEEEAIDILKYDKDYHKDFLSWKADFVKWESQKVYNPTEFRKLLSKHFDLFNLIPEGLAIDKTTLNKQ